MKLPALVAAFVFSSFASSFALTQAEIAPTALKGKTLTFTVVNGSTPYATNGTWSGTFSAAGTSFAIAKITGDTVNLTTTCDSGSVSGIYTNFSLAKFIEGQSTAHIDLWVDDQGVGKYEVYIDGLFGTGLNGTFTLGTPVVTGPEVGIQQPVGTNLTDGKSTKGYGKVKTGKSKSKTFTVANTGNKNLSGLKVTVTGTDKASFTVQKPSKTTVAAGATNTFKVTFSPKSKGAKKATLRILSNDVNEGSFDIKLTGTGAK